LRFFQGSSGGREYFSGFPARRAVSSKLVFSDISKGRAFFLEKAHQPVAKRIKVVLPRIIIGN
jgi:hypothetical protein